MLLRVSPACPVISLCLFIKYRYSCNSYVSTVLDQGKLPLPCQPPRHHWIEQEGSDHPVSGDCLSSIQSKAHHQLAARSQRPNPLMMVSPSPQRMMSHRRMGVTELRFTTEPELLVMSDQVREPATMPAARKRAVDSESTERSSALCTMAARNLGMLEASVSPVPMSSPERATIPTSGPGRAKDPESNPGRAPISSSSQERAPVAPSSPEIYSVRPGEGFCSRIWPREGFRSQDRPREGFHSRI